MTITLKRHGGIRFLAVGRARVSFCMAKVETATVDAGAALATLDGRGICADYAGRELFDCRTGATIARADKAGRWPLATVDAYGRAKVETGRGRGWHMVAVAAMLTLATVTAMSGGRLTRPVAASAATLASVHAFHGLAPLATACEIIATDSHGGEWIVGRGSDAAGAYQGIVIPAGAVDLRESGAC